MRHEDDAEEKVKSGLGDVAQGVRMVSNQKMRRGKEKETRQGRRKNGWVEGGKAGKKTRGRREEERERSEGATSMAP